MFKIGIYIAIPFALAFFIFPQFRTALAGLAPFAIAAVCPLAMIFGMRGMTSAKSCERVFACVECGLEYSDKEWAVKCQAWCKEHKSCNLEITEHAVKS